MGFYHCANIPASTVPFHFPRSHGSALRFRSFRLRLASQTVPTPLHSPSSCGSASQSRHSQLRLTTQAVTVPAFCLTVPAVSTPPHISNSPDSASQPKQLRFCLSVPAITTPLHNPSSYSPSIPPLSPGTLNSASQHDTDKVFFSFIADFLQGFLDLNANIIRHSCDLIFHLLRYHFVQ